MKKGGASELCIMGDKYRTGKIGQWPDDHMAFECYVQASEKGNAKAFFNLGMYYLKGKVVGRDTNKASYYITKAANAGLKEAEAYLAWQRIGSNKGVEKEKALEYIDNATKKGSPVAWYIKGLLARSGIFQSNNSDNADFCFKQATFYGFNKK